MPPLSTTLLQRMFRWSFSWGTTKLLTTRRQVNRHTWEVHPSGSDISPVPSSLGYWLLQSLVALFLCFVFLKAATLLILMPINNQYSNSKLRAPRSTLIFWPTGYTNRILQQLLKCHFQQVLELRIIWSQLNSLFVVSQTTNKDLQ